MIQKRFTMNKLVRDNIPAIMRKAGILVHERVLEQEEFIEKVKEKLHEEAIEVQRAQNTHELAEELADVLQVVYALSAAYGLTFEEIEKLRLAKQEEKGGFHQKIYTSWIDIEESNPAYARYLTKSHGHEVAGCLFCEMGRSKRQASIREFAYCYAFKDEFPVSPGHVLIIPYEHTEHWFTARHEVRTDMIRALDCMKEQLDAEYTPHGYNIGANCGLMAGQSIMHLHMHLIPRYQGDMDNPKGGVRGVIPSKQKY